MYSKRSCSSYVEEDMSEVAKRRVVSARKALTHLVDGKQMSIPAANAIPAAVFELDWFSSIAVSHGL